DNGINDTSYSPRIALTHKLSKNQSIRFNISTATRSPSSAEESIEIVYYPALHISGVGICNYGIPGIVCEPGTDDTIAYTNIISPGGLDFEKIVSTEIGYYGNLNKVNMNAKIFHDEISDLIVDISNGEFENAPGKINVSGFEYTLNYKPGTRFNIYFNYTKIVLEDNLDRSLTTYEDFSDTAPTDSYSLALFTQFDKLMSGSIEYINIGEMRWLDDNTPNDEYKILNLKLTYKIKLKKSTLKASLVFENLAEEINDYGEFGSIPESTRGKTAFIDIELVNF
ncbi:MAG: TonB-dependent receptor, partial [Gammaproteobacteria bacterium]|nr:TonB-dependent receptor [Gammaproteobacteria bacterium]